MRFDLIKYSLCFFMLPVIFLFLITACDSKDEAFESEFLEVMSNKTGEDLFNALLDMDQRYPDKLVLKVNIGGMLLDAGNMEKASLYLKRGEELAEGQENNKYIKSLLYINLAELYYRQAEYEKGIDYAIKALEMNPEEKIGVIFTKAKCLASIGMIEDALESFDSGWKEQKEIMGGEDLKAYYMLLTSEGRYERAVEVLSQYQKKVGYEEGLGIEESILYEKLGRVNEGILAAAKDLEYQRFYGLVTDSIILEKLAELEGKLGDTSWNPDNQGYEIINALKQYVQKNWGQVIEYLLPFEKQLELPFFTYLLYSAKLEKEEVELIDLERFVSVEEYFKDLPGFYYYLWQGMKRGQGDYSLKAVRKVLEKCILLSPNTVYALETRVELGRLLGLEPEQGKKLLIGPELDSIHIRLANGENASILDPVMDLLSTPDNVYEMAAVLMLGEAKKIPVVKDYLVNKRDNSSGRLKERLVSILAE
jgi:tetratricopeptide (TPR) repeat protein